MGENFAKRIDHLSNLRRWFPILLLVTLCPFDEAEVIIEAAPEEVAVVGNEIQLTCHYNSSPVASEVQWLKNGTVISRNDTMESNARGNITHFNESSIQLTINPSISSDAANYTCLVTNDVDNSSDTTVIRVKPDPPHNLLISSTTSRTLTVSWSAGFNGNSEINSYKVDISQDNQTFEDVSCQESSNNNLCTVPGVVTNVTLKDLHPFTMYYLRVFAVNKIGQSESSEVMNASTGEEVPSAPPSNVTGRNKSSTSIFVQWDQVPAADQNGHILSYTVTYTQLPSGPEKSKKVFPPATQTTLIGLNEYTYYSITVFASTSKGGGYQSMPIVVITDEGKPSAPPANVRAQNTNSTSIFVQWDQVPEVDQNGVILSYTVTYRALSSDSSQTKNVTAPANQTTLTGFNEYTNYSITVFASTSKGGGNRSTPIVVIIDEDIPSQAPVNLSVTSKTSTSIMVSWQPPPLESRNGIIIGFKLFYKRKGSTDLGHTVNIRNALTHNATRLLKYTEYEFQVLAFTQIGNGPNSPVLATRTKHDVPSRAPVNFTVASQTSTHGILASWQLPPTDSRNGIIIGFKLFHKRKGSAESENTVVVQGGTTLRKSITGLLKYTEYEVQVLAFTAVGDGPRTLIKTVRTVPEFSVPTIEEDVSPAFVICEMGTLCLLFCYATSEFPRTMMYSWTKNGVNLADGNTFKVMNTSVVVRPHRMEDYGVYACKASNGIHTTTYNITLGVKLNSSAVVIRRAENESHDSRFVVTVTVLSTVIMLLLIPNGLLLWQRRKRSRQITNVSENWHTRSQSRAPMSSGETERAYMELQPQGESLKHEYQTLQGKVENTEYDDVQLSKDNVVEDTGDYEIAATF